MNKELMEALDILEKEKEISKDTLFEAIENSLITACKNHFGKSDNVRVEIDRDTCDFLCYAEKEVVEEVEDDCLQITYEDAQKIKAGAEVGDIIHVEIKSKEFGRIATQNAKNVILQKIREEERSVIYNQYFEKEKDIVTGIVQRYIGRNISINLGKADGILNESEQVRGESFKPTERIKVYILEVKNTPRGPRILVSRTHPELVKRLFEAEVTEIKDGTVEIMSIAREAGSRTKMAVRSNNPNVDAVGACVGLNGARVNSIVDELRGEKIDIINWDENPGYLIQNALSPAKIVTVFADSDERTAKVVVPDYQLSLAIGKEGQNARLAARLTGYKIDIKSETQAKDAPGFRYEDYMDEYEEYDEYDEYDEEYGGDDESGYDEEGYDGGAREDGYDSEYDGEAGEDGYDEEADEDYDGEKYDGEADVEDYDGETDEEGYDGEADVDGYDGEAGEDEADDEVDEDEDSYGGGTDEEEYDGEADEEEYDGEADEEGYDGEADADDSDGGTDGEEYEEDAAGVEE